MHCRVAAGFARHFAAPPLAGFATPGIQPGPSLAGRSAKTMWRWVPVTASGAVPSDAVLHSGCLRLNHVGGRDRRSQVMPACAPRIPGLVAAGGFEPPTSGVWARRATRLLYAALLLLPPPRLPRGGMLRPPAGRSSSRIGAGRGVCCTSMMHSTIAPTRHSNTKPTWSTPCICASWLAMVVIRV